MRRRGPRRLADALDATLREALPPTLLARAQSVWGEVAGPAVAAESQPISEREGVVTVTCSSAVWAQELDLLAPDLLPRINAALGGTDGAAAVRRLRFVAGS